jgi:putative transcription antitermination factor YqgF
MAVLAIDYGDRYLGLAVETVAGPMPLDPIDIKKAIWNQRVSSIVDQYDINKVIVGYSSGNKALLVNVQSFAKAVGGLTALPVELVDESMTSKWAEDMLRSFSLPSSAIKAKSHSVAAVKFLAGYLEGQKRGVVAFS